MSALMAEPTTEPTAPTAPVPMPAPVDATLFTAERPVPAAAVVRLVASPATERPAPTGPPAALPAAPRTPETTFRPRIPTDPAAVRVAASNLPLDLPDVAIVGPLLSSVPQRTRGPSSVV